MGEANVAQILQLPQELREVAVAALSIGDLTAEQLSGPAPGDSGECRRRLDELVKLGHLKEQVSCGRVVYQTTYRVHSHKRILGQLTSD